MADEIVDVVDLVVDQEDIGTEETGVVDTEGNPEETRTEGQPEEKQLFNPDEMEFDDLEEQEKNEKFHGFDMQVFADKLDLENPEAVEIISNKLSTLKENGFSQEQAETVINMLIDEHSSEETTPEQVREELKKSLTFEEKKNYKAVGGYLKDITKGDEILEKAYEEAMSNPIVFKLLHSAYKSNMRGKSTGTDIKAREERNINKMSSDSAITEYQTFLKSNSNKGIDTKTYAKSLLSKMSAEEADKFRGIMGALLD